MSEFDPTAVVQFARRYLETIKEPRRRQILQNFIDHAEAEALGNYDALMESCSRKQQHYASYGSRFGAPQSYAELEEHYRGLIASNIYVIHFEPEKLIVGEDELVIEGLVHQLYPGELIEPMYGFKVDDPTAVYQATKRTCVFFVFDEEGLGAGEHSYSDGLLTADDLVKLAPEEVPEIFHSNPLGGDAAAAGVP
ncbi:MAG: hypothetical protein CL908_24595 [Deltaproteobacteria bacterium]|nr:hypothetical protein [Deltaproteobacteria bacterium]